MIRMFELRKERAFSLVELMIVVAIIAILAAIAIPAFMRFAMKSKTSEATGNLSALRTCEVSYKAENDVYLAAAETPSAGGNDAKPDAWPATGTDGVDAYDQIGFAPDGDVRYKYLVGPGTGGSAVVDGEFRGAFKLTATSNLDEDVATDPGTFIVDSGVGGYPKPVWNGEF